jgi:hypothetical protein
VGCLVSLLDLGAGRGSRHDVRAPAVPRRAFTHQTLEDRGVARRGRVGGARLRLGVHAWSLARLPGGRQPCGGRLARRERTGGRRRGMVPVLGVRGDLRVLHGGTLPSDERRTKAADQVVRLRQRPPSGRLGGQLGGSGRRLGWWESAGGGFLDAGDSLPTRDTRRGWYSDPQAPPLRHRHKS